MNSDLDRLLAAPPERDLPNGRHRLFREQLMREIRTEKRSVRTRVAISAAIAGTTAVLVGGAFVATQTIGAAPSKSSTAVDAQFRAGSASSLLLQMAAYSEKLPSTQSAHNGQWVYVKSESRDATQPPAPGSVSRTATLGRRPRQRSMGPRPARSGRSATCSSGKSGCQSTRIRRSVH
ncbi:hypothetical protein [Fodinicola feengrottensis]|uniref:hypothetical protein n=1 Tax=Fodinicola feengrottensis TaxID=435914 RepID=UPI0013D0ABDF|nr:hypothetical protein [Fodinicola feengrottensis]